jgi:glucosylceramidase
MPKGPYNYGPKQTSSNYDMLKMVLKLPDMPTRFEEPLDSVVNVSINRTATYQKIIGFGGAFTGAVSHNLNQLESDELRRHVYESYYSKEIGIGYSLMRFPIGGCDFDLEPWAYNEYPDHDPYLTNFNQLDPRDLEKIEQINELKKLTENYDIKLIGAAWSPPRWMKTNGDWTGFSALRDEYYQTWADYHVKYLELMHESNFSFWAVSTGNEPLNGVIMPYFVHFMSLGWLPKDQGKWVAENLGPSIRKSTTAFNVKILGGDDQRFTFPWWFEQMYESNSDVAQYIDGLAVHWYGDKYFGPTPLDEAAEKFPGKFIISTEACSGDRPW